MIPSSSRPDPNRFAFAALLLALMLAALITPARAQDKPAPPNIIVIFADDQGYQDMGVFGSPNIKTPNMDRMAREGMRFTSFYSAASVCTPSRAALMTGCYPERVGRLG
ncbi:MAG: sulfatase-like hydrolase/transferase, partial [Phycisphaeraceae bacterium]|nr:sulfatase-like hydrolase/transferase [Phycisphaeraceae bacterium]